MENKKNLRLTRQTPAIARDSKEENETGAAALEAVTHRDGAAAQPVSSRCGTGTGASRAGERGLPLPSHGRLDWRSAQPEAPGWAVPTDPEREAQLPPALRPMPQPHGAGPGRRGESHTLQGHSLGPTQHSRAASQAQTLQTAVESDCYQTSVYSTDVLRRCVR